MAGPGRQPFLDEVAKPLLGLLFLVTTILVLGNLLFILGSLVPVGGGLLGWLGLVYALGLALIAYQALSDLPWWKAAAGLLLGLVLTSLSWVCIGAFLLSMAGGLPQFI